MHLSSPILPINKSVDFKFSQGENDIWFATCNVKSFKADSLKNSKGSVKEV